MGGGRFPGVKQTDERQVACIHMCVCACCLTAASAIRSVVSFIHRYRGAEKSSEVMTLSYFLQRECASESSSFSSAEVALCSSRRRVSISSSFWMI